MNTASLAASAGQALSATRNTIQIGAPAEFEHQYGRRGCACAVYKKTCGLTVSFIIAKIPPKVRAGTPTPPASVLREFDNRPDAIAALDKWATAPVDAKPAKKVKNPTRAHANHLPKRKGIGAGQTELPFS